MKNTIINIQELVPKEWIIKDLTENIIITFKRKGSGPQFKQITLPKTILMDEYFIAGIAMYLGDGSLNNSDKYHLSFCSKDQDLIKFMKNFFEKYFLIKNDQFSYYIKYSTSKPNLVKSWSTYLDISQNDIKVYHRKRYRDEAFTLQINSFILRTLFKKIIDVILNMDYIHNKTLRRAFLSGLFAAEGGIGIQTKENYLAYIAFHLSLDKEKWLADLVQRLLDLEGIHSKQLTRPNKGERYIQITNWNNYCKLLLIDLFELNSRKKNKFMKHLSSRNFYYQISDLLKSQILKDTNPRMISLAINENYENILRSFKTNSWSAKSFYKIMKQKGINLELVKKEVLAINMSNKLNISEDRKFIEFIFGLNRTKEFK